MAMSSKVFIYQHSMASEKSGADLAELMKSNGVFPTRPDVIMSNFESNYTGLSRPTFVVPGGLAPAFGRELASQFTQIRTQLKKDDFNYIGVCAGAFVGTEKVDYYSATHMVDTQTKQLVEPTYLFSADKGESVGLLNDYKAVGSFYPNDSHFTSQAKAAMPYRVELSFNTGERLSQLYVAGPGFAKQPLSQQSTVVATYADRKQYSFTSEESREVINDFPAMIQRLPTQEKGGILLTGTHIEACLANSQFLTFFKQSQPKNATLSNNDYEHIVKDQQKAKTKIESLLNQTVSFR